MWIILHKPKDQDQWKTLGCDLTLEEDKAKLLLAIKRKHYSQLAEFKLAEIKLLNS